MICKCCELDVPERCTGRIEDHCTWCGGPYCIESLRPDEERFCSRMCYLANESWEMNE